MKAIFRIFSAALLLFISIDVNAADAPKLVMEEFMVPAVDPGISLYVLKPSGVQYDMELSEGAHIRPSKGVSVPSWRDFFPVH